MTVPPLEQHRFDFAAASRIVREPRRNIVIEAGAGTGKTTAIVAEVLKLLLEEELKPERIVLVTFTEKAAGEIADRIHEALADLELRFDDDEIVWPIGSPRPLFRVDRDRRELVRTACARQLARIDSLRSQTIHSFCQTLLRQFPIEAGLDPQFTIIEGFERARLHEELYDAWVDSETRTHPREEQLAEWETLLAHVGYLFAVKDLVFSLAERRDLLAANADLGDVVEAEREFLPALDIIDGAPLPTIDAMNDDGARALFRYLKWTARPERGSVNAWIDYFAPVVTFIREAKLPAGKANAELKEALRILRSGDKGDSIHDRLVSHRAAVALHALVRRFVDWTEKEKHARGVVDFDDLLLRTLALLGNEAVLERVREQYDAIFVDEFQDTDRTQAQIIELLARDRSGSYVNGRTILVGDPKQSIYGFRRADPETYYQLTESLVDGGAERRIITDQYRSDPALLRAINAIFRTMFPIGLARDPNVFRPSYHALAAGKAASAQPLDATITFLYSEHEEKSERYFSEADAVARWILEHRTHQPRDLQRFALLFRRLTRIDDYLDALDRHNLEYVLPPTRLFLDRRAPVDLVTMLRAIAYPFDRGALISAARTPYIALTDAEIAAGALDDPAATAWRRYLEALARFREHARHQTVSETIDMLLATSSIADVYAHAADGARSMRYVEHLRGIAFEYDQKIGGSLRQFVDEIARRRDEPDEMEPSLTDETRNAVRILSVHAAKGLEFESVILPDLVFPTSNPDALQLFTVDAPRSLVLCGRADSISSHFRLSASGERLKSIHAEREKAEMRRLFYVAVTRAQREVVFVCDSGAFKKSGFFACVAEAFAFEKEGFASLWPGEGRHVRSHRVGDDEIEVAFERLPASGRGDRVRRRLADPALEAQFGAGALHEPEIGVAGAAERLTPADAAKRRAASRNRGAGILLHRVLERWDGQPQTLEPLLRALAAEQGASTDAVTKVQQRLNTIAASPTLQRVLAAETIGRELPITTTDEEGHPFDGRIDRLLLENGRELVVDYKSGEPSPERIDRDREQVLGYCSAITRLTGRPAAGLLWYIDTDHDEAIDV
jgi:ATP-dependent helicase/nuclease subunit A